MSAKMIIPQQEADQGFALLKSIVAMVENPDSIDEAYERRQKAAQLSDDEVQKAADARALIAQADDLRAELKKQEDDLTDSKLDHESVVSAFAEKVTAENARLTEWETRLNGITAQQFETSQKLTDTAKALDDRQAQIQADKDAWDARYNERLTAVADKEVVQKAEDERLGELKAKLLAKAARLAAEAQIEE